MASMEKALKKALRAKDIAVSEDGLGRCASLAAAHGLDASKFTTSYVTFAVLQDKLSEPLSAALLDAFREWLAAKAVGGGGKAGTKARARV